MDAANDTFALRDADGNIWGPLTLGELQKLLQQRKNLASASVARVGQPFRPVASYPELQSVLFQQGTQPSFTPPPVAYQEIQEPSGTLRVVFSVSPTATTPPLSTSPQTPNHSRPPAASYPPSPQQPISQRHPSQGQLYPQPPHHGTPQGRAPSQGILSTQGRAPSQGVLATQGRAPSQGVLATQGRAPSQGVLPVLQKPITGIPPTLQAPYPNPNSISNPSPSAKPPSQPPPSAIGELQSIPFPRLLYGLFANQMTGRLLLLQEDESQAQIYFAKGIPLMLPSLSDPEDLQQRILARGLCMREQIEPIVQRATRPGTGYLGHQLVAMGIVDAHLLMEIYEEQIKEFILSFFSWMRGRFFFFTDQAPREMPIPLSVHVIALIREGIERAYLLKRLQNYLEPYNQCSVAIVESPALSMESLRLSPKETRLIHHAQRARSLGELLRTIEKTGLFAPHESLRFLFFLAEIEILRLDGQILGQNL